MARSTELVSHWGDRRTGVRARLLSTGLPAVGVVGALLVFLIVFPLGVLFYSAFSNSNPGEFSFAFSDLTLDTIRRTLQSETLQTSAVTTLRVVALGTAIAFIAAVGLAWLVARTDVPCRRLIGFGAVAPLFISPLVAAIAWSTLGSPYSGLLNLLLRDLGINIVVNIQSEIGVAFVMGTTYAPYAYLLILSSLEGVDATMEEAASICGASQRKTFTRITMSLIRPAAYASILLVGVTLLGVYAIPFLIGEPGGVEVLTTYIGRLILQSNPNYQVAAGIGLLLALFTAICVLIQNRLLRNRQYATVAGKTQRRRRLQLRRLRYPAAIVAISYLLITVVVPLIALLLTALRTTPFYSSFLDAFDTDKLSIGNFEALRESPILARAIFNSIAVASMTAIIGVTIAFVISYINRRTRYRGGSILDTVAMTPVAVPGLIIGLGFLWAWISLPFPFYGTLFILVAAFVAHQLPTGLRSIDSTLLQIHPELEEAAASCGASRRTVITAIVLPLTRTGLLASATLFFVFAVREIGSILFLYNSSTTVMSVQVLDTWNRGAVGAAAALAVVQAVVVAVAVTLGRAAERMGRR